MFKDVKTYETFQNLPANAVYIVTTGSEPMMYTDKEKAFDTFGEYIYVFTRFGGYTIATFHLEDGKQYTTNF